MTSLVDSALEWAEAGYYVYPVDLFLGEDGKKVVDFPGPWQESTRDPDTIRDLFDGATGVAVDTGKSGVVVVDIDISDTKDGLRNLEEAGIKLPASRMQAETWSGGFHGFFRQPDPAVGSGSNRPVRDVDFRGRGGVVFVAPTIVCDGATGEVRGTYRLLGPLVAVDALEVLPESYAVRLRAEPRTARPGAFTRPSVPTTLRDDQRELLERYIEQDLEIIRQSVSGSRNEALGRTLFLADRYRKLGHSYESFKTEVLEAYKESGGTDESQAVKWCESSWGKSSVDPLGVPRTDVDDMAEQYHRRLVAQRLARARVTGASARLVDASSFVDWTQDPPAPEFWVAGVLPKGEQVVLYGRPEAGKTFTALAWGLSVATGRPWFGRQVEQTRVWFMAGEGNTRITSRIHAWTEHAGTRPDPAQFRLLNHVPDLMNDQVIDQVARKIAEDEVDIGFIDTLNRAMSIGGGDIGNPPDANQALRSLQHLSKYRPSFTPVVIHHPIKEGTMAGAYTLLGGVDVALHAEVGVDTGGIGTLRFQKNKDGAKTAVCSYRWLPVGGSAVLVPAFGPAGPYPGGDPDLFNQDEEDRRRRDHG